ncbi:DUF3060 domain-containing protein [Nocardiopsis changdeensis]|uniref:DUF3060 domain-containing protein n=1 Tax=Nocardiopsis changdeensis TaxID=2831969 RepID=A0ABX8BIC6_9ACTN|nr:MULTISPECIES: DUF3060 domain-containing protein [Nocardiopsis]QUX21994.1 DUF3060 domain-containing protein [Nocardiopsis changdeensis]QYX37931.1 DUF3060 domain-containing protein [Nocardiopsis sp. MT53]
MTASALRTPARLAAVLATAAAFGLTGCSFSLPGGQDVSVDPDGVSVRDGESEVSVDGEGGVSVDNGEGEVSVDGEGGVGVGGDEVLNVTGGDLTEDCEGRAVNIASEDAVVVLNGSCTTVTVAGSNLTVHIGSADSIHVIGADNTVHYASGEPEVTDLGGNNSVSSGGDATP